MQRVGAVSLGECADSRATTGCRRKRGGPPMSIPEHRQTRSPWFATTLGSFRSPARLVVRCRRLDSRAKCLNVCVLALALFTGSATSGPALAQCIDYASYLRWVGRAPTQGAAFAVALEGDYACVIEGQSYHGFEVIDISDPESPVVVSSLPMTWPLDVAVSRSIAYVANDPSGISVISIENPQSPRFIGYLSTTAPPRGVTIVDTIAYVAVGTGGILVVDISDPRDPQVLSSLDTPGFAAKVVVGSTDGTAPLYAYVADGSSLQIVDVSNPLEPWIVGSASSESLSMDVAIVGTHAFVADAYAGLQVYDVSDPAAPRWVSDVDIPG